MTDPRRTGFDRLADTIADGLLALAAALAPGSERRPWLREWEAEIAHLRGRPGSAGRGFEIIRRSGGAVMHALWLRGQEWRPDMLMQDLKFAVRGLVKRPVFTLVVVATIALGVGVNAGIFSVLYDVVLEPLPYESPDELVMVWEHNVPRDNRTNVVAPANFFVWRDDTELFSELAAVTWFSQTLTGTEDAQRVGALAVNWNFFPLLGVQPHRGRFFTADEDDPASTARPVVLGYAFWRDQFGAADEVLGSTIELNGSERTVIGVLPPGFNFDHLPFAFNSTGTQDVWMPQAFDSSLREWRGRWLQVVGRLAEGVSVERAQAELATVASRLEREFPEGQTGWTVNIVPLRSQIVGTARTPLIILFGAVSLVLLIACANVANLLLSRSTSRNQEIAVRTALGANRLRLMRQLLTEAGVLAVTGGALGLLFAWSLVRGLVALGPDVPRISEVGLDSTAVIFTIVVSLLTGLLFGLVPAIRASRPDLAGTFKEGTRGGRSAAVLRARNALVVSEIALALVLLVGSGLLIRSFGSLMDRGVGFETSGLMTATVSLPTSDYPEQADRIQFFEQAIERLSAAPGVRSASAIWGLPLSGAATATSYWTNDRAIPPEGERPVADIRWAHRDYFRTMEIPILQGRAFTASDVGDGYRAVISETMARRHWPDESPIGRTLSMPWADTVVAEIVGVVGDVRHNGPEVEARDKIYYHQAQWDERSEMSLVVRAEGDPTRQTAAIRAAVNELDPGLALYNVRSMDEWMSDTMASRRFVMLALGIFALVALMLASIGVYGVMSYNVSQRTQEFGVRIALGASAGDVVRDVVGAGLKLVLLAVLIGTVGALALSRLLQSLVFGVSTTDPLSFVLAGTFLLLIAAIACYRPAHRAGKVDPIEALRFE